MGQSGVDEDESAAACLSGVMRRPPPQGARHVPHPTSGHCLAYCTADAGQNLAIPHTRRQINTSAAGADRPSAAIHMFLPARIMRRRCCGVGRAGERGIRGTQRGGGPAACTIAAPSSRRTTRRPAQHSPALLPPASLPPLQAPLPHQGNRSSATACCSPAASAAWQSPSPAAPAAACAGAPARPGGSDGSGGDGRGAQRPALAGCGRAAWVLARIGDSARVTGMQPARQHIPFLPAPPAAWPAAAPLPASSARPATSAFKCTHQLSPRKAAWWPGELAPPGRRCQAAGGGGLCNPFPPSRGACLLVGPRRRLALGPRLTRPLLLLCISLRGNGLVSCTISCSRLGRAPAPLAGTEAATEQAPLQGMLARSHAPSSPGASL